MTSLKLFPGLILLTMGILLTSCGPDSSLDKDALIGRWELRQATRDGKPTESLDQLYYEFIEDGSMKSNLAGQTESGKYEIDNEKLLQRDTKLEVDYLIESLSDSVMTLTTNLRNIHFKFVLEKVIKEE